MTSSRFWINAAEWLSDSRVRSLTYFERDAFMKIRCLMRLRSGCSLPDDDRYMARALGTKVLVWRQLRFTLLALGLLVKRDGRLYDLPLFLQSEEAEKRSATASRNAMQGWRKRRHEESQQGAGQDRRIPLHHKHGEYADAKLARADSDTYNLEDL